MMWLYIGLVLLHLPILFLWRPARRKALPAPRTLPAPSTFPAPATMYYAQQSMSQKDALARCCAAQSRASVYGNALRQYAAQQSGAAQASAQQSDAAQSRAQQSDAARMAAPPTDPSLGHVTKENMMWRKRKVNSSPLSPISVAEALEQVQAQVDASMTIPRIDEVPWTVLEHDEDTVWQSGCTRTWLANALPYTVDPEHESCHIVYETEYAAKCGDARDGDEGTPTPHTLYAAMQIAASFGRPYLVVVDEAGIETRAYRVGMEVR